MTDKPRPATPDPSKTRRGGRPARRGGRRPGAGAPKGNMNALKSGRYSKQMKALRLALQAMPATSDVVRRFDAAGAGKRALLAMSLQHYAELLVAEPVVLADIVDLLQSAKLSEAQPQPAKPAGGRAIVDLLKQTKLTPQNDPLRPNSDTAKR